MLIRDQRLLAVLLALLAVLGALGASTIPQAGDQASDEVVLVGAGDIAGCDWQGDEETSALLDRIDGIVFTVGDHAYPHGTTAEFRECYDPSWGRHRDRTRPAPGTHDYETEGARPYYEYFGPAAGNPSRGYYGYAAGEYWHVVVLNTECDEVGGCDHGSPQAEWLQSELARNAGKHILAYWHRPRFSSGTSGDDLASQAFWEILHDHGAELVLNGDEHAYERFARQDPGGQADEVRGIRQFVVGTGGAKLYPKAAERANSEVFHAGSHGVLKLTLGPDEYSWEFVPVQLSVFRDAGSTPTRTPPRGIIRPPIL